MDKMYMLILASADL